MDLKPVHFSVNILYFKEQQKFIFKMQFTCVINE
jgi:hypothetical protein